jgi:hypothetical protein
VQHISLEEERIDVWLFAPVVITDMLECFPDFSSDREMPTVTRL